ncbi:hypothetical protein GCM10010464_55340 [Pseudonocardia yunnanensis]|uniref:Uncharacterized protein n=1 Tax=Pseudonocardia yunnanensis TaxID=58107 RepID=A0ABW4F4Q2_9PSEU
MTRLTFAIGGILTALGIVAYVVTGAASITALIPTFVGLLLLICAALARRPALHRHSIHAALVIALLGAVGSLMNVVKLGDVFAGTAERPSAVVVSTIMFVLLVVYVIMGVRSFIAARRSPAPTERL